MATSGGDPKGTREAAREYLRRGWAPIPVPHGAKGPILDAWQNLRITEEDLDRYFDKPSNLGLLTGTASAGLSDVDLDCDEAVTLAHHFLPPTPMRSGRPSCPGSHYWYVTAQVPTYAIFKDIDKDATTLLELRTDGHQSIVPPSIHPEGEPYEWYGPLEPAEVEGHDLERAVRRLAAATLFVRHWPTKPGSRHDIANALAGMLMRAGWSEEMVAQFIEIVASTAGDEETRSRVKGAITTSRAHDAGRKTTGAPTLATLIGDSVVDRLRAFLQLKDHEVQQAVIAGWSAPASFRSYKLPEFPIEALPAGLAEFALEEARATQTPLALAGGLVLAACATALGGKVRVLIRDGWLEPLNLFVVVVLDPGNRKSAVFSDVTRPILDYEEHEQKKVTPLIQKAHAEHEIVEQRYKTLVRRASRAKPAERKRLEEEAREAAAELQAIQIPTFPRFFADDITAERLSDMLCEQGGRFAVLSPEGGIFEILAGRYSAQQAPNIDIFLKGHAGDPLRVDRMSRPSVFVNRPALTVGLTVQQDVLRGLEQKPGFRGRGLIGRFLFAIPKSPLGARTPGAPAVAAPVQNKYYRRLHRLLELAAPNSDPGTFHTLRFSPEAERKMLAFETWLEPLLGESGSLSTMTDWAGKLAGAVARLSGLLHLATHADDPEPWTRPITVATLEDAIELGRFYLDHAQAAYGDMGADPEVERAKHVLRWIQRERVSTFSERDAFQALRGRFKTVAGLRPVLSLLVDHGYLRELARPEKSTGRPRGQAYEVNPGFEDIEDIGKEDQKRTSDDTSRPPESDGLSEANSGPPTHNPQYPQNNRDSDQEDPGDDEGVV